MATLFSHRWTPRFYEIAERLSTTVEMSCWRYKQTYCFYYYCFSVTSISNFVSHIEFKIIVFFKLYLKCQMSENFGKLAAENKFGKQLQSEYSQTCKNMQKGSIKNNFCCFISSQKISFVGLFFLSVPINSY